MAKPEDGKEAAMEMAEAARETEWKFPSFTAEMFRGKFRWDLLHPYPEQDGDETRIGDELIAKVRTVLEEHLDPIAVDDTGQYPQAALDALAAIGIFGMRIDKEYGGLGLSYVNYCRLLSFIGSYCQSTVVWVSAHQSIGVPQPLKIFGTEEQKKKYLPRLAKGEISAFALTESDVGSDPARMTTTATPSDDGPYYLLNGLKLWCSNGPDAKLAVIMAQTPPAQKHGREVKQISCFVVEMDSPGIDVVNRCQFMGLHGLSNGEIALNNVKVPAENLIGKEGEGLKIALTTLNTGRLGMPAACSGVVKGLLPECQRWVSERIQWGVPIGKHQSVSKKIANMASDTFAMESLTYITAAFADQENADMRLEAAAAKYFTTETSWRMLDDMLQVRGGRGYESDLSLYKRGERPVSVERHLRDARIGRIFEGSSEVMHLIMAREAMDTHFKLVMPLLMPKPWDKRSKLSLLWNAAKFYARWYPKLWLPARGSFNVRHLNGPNVDHLLYIARRSKKLARKLFHTMAKYQAKLEFEQLILANFVDIGVDLYVMGCVLANAERLAAKKHAGTTALDLADLFCKNARKRIEQNFKAVGDNHNRQYNKVADALMEGKLGWLVQDVFGDLPPKYRDYAKHAYQPKAAEEMEPAGR